MANGRMVERTGRVRDSYFALIQRFPLRPIKTERELNTAIKIVDELIDRSDLDSGESDYLEVLGDLVERYESESQPTEHVSDGSMLEHLLEAKGVSQSEASR